MSLYYHGTNRPLEGTVDPAEQHARNFGISDYLAIYLTERPEEARWHANYVAKRDGGEARVYAVRTTGAVMRDLQQRQPGFWKTRRPVIVVGEV